MSYLESILQFNQDRQLAYEVTRRVLTPYLGVLHVMWGTWYMDDPWSHHDGYACERWVTH